jgi:hypothetical protein
MIKNNNNNNIHKNNKKNKKNDDKNNSDNIINDFSDKKFIYKSNDVKKNNDKCFTPCYPPNYLKYHPYYLSGTRDDRNSCLTESGESLYCDKITPNYKSYNIFETTGYVKNDESGFILELYDINNVSHSVKFLENEIDKVPSLLTMKRILTAIFNKYSKNQEFPLYLFSEKFKYVFKKYYKINKKIDYFNDIKNIIFSNEEISDIFIFFCEKFL